MFVRHDTPRPKDLRERRSRLLNALSQAQPSTDTTSTDINEVLLFGGGLDSQVGSVVGRVPKGPGSIPDGTQVLGTDGICKYLPVLVSTYVKVW